VGIDQNPLGGYLKDRRARLDPAALGFPLSRRRTPGLRREEVAQRANVSATWYTWLEQGRGGAPSSDVLERIARALMLTAVEREHLFLLGLGRPPQVRYQPSGGISPRLQGVLDAFECTPAFLRTSTWDVVAWNRPASLVLGDFDVLAPEERNVLRRMFLDPAARAAMPNWESDARFMVGAFRADITRSGATQNGEALIEELSSASPEFAALWRDNDVRTAYGEHPKQRLHPVLGLIDLDYSAFAVDGRPDLFLVVMRAATDEVDRKIRTLFEKSSFV
jgi:transcriptional regulator with XRE-family HTH domain